MHATTLSANPFGLLTDPQAILDAMERSTVLESLNRRICRPLDRPAPGNGDDAPPAAVGCGSPDQSDQEVWIG